MESTAISSLEDRNPKTERSDEHLFHLWRTGTRRLKEVMNISSLEDRNPKTERSDEHLCGTVYGSKT
jgi:hypothetical protein